MRQLIELETLIQAHLDAKEQERFGNETASECISAFLFSGVELPVYDCTKYYLLPYLHDGVYNHFVSSMAAGLATALASTPIDVVKTRMMNQRNLKSTVLSDGKEM